MATKKVISAKIEQNLYDQVCAIANSDDRSVSNQINRFIKSSLADYVKANNLTWDEENEQYISCDDNTSTHEDLKRQDLKDL